jgi:cellulose synthase/poly-beta-1,6-N-acetylglucosamine synthase-like glycosyltransferase
MEILLWVMVTILLIPTAIVVLECLMACLPGLSQQDFSKVMRPRLVVLMPAHNESAVLAETLASIMPQLQAGDRLLLVADNCSDNTAAIAKLAGAQVLERFNDELRGKGYALAFGLNALRADPPEVLIIIDADCQIKAGALEVLAKAASQYNKPVQSLYFMQAGADSGVRQKIAAFAWIIKNQVRALGQLRLCMPCPLMGTGMAFPWHIISRMELANGALVEDMLLGGELVAAGQAPMFCPAACVTSQFPAAEQAVNTQRRRWEHGHLSMILNYFPRLLKDVFKRGDFKGIFFVFDMMVPPLTLQSMFMLLGLCITGLAAWFGDVWPFMALLGGVVLFALALALAWYRYGQNVITVKDALQIPVYIFSKLTVYASFLFSREKNWVKTKR